MIRPIYCLLVAGLLLPALSAAAADDAACEAEAKKYTLRYQFRPGETLRWEVVHRTRTRTTVSGITQTAETLSKSVKVWHVTEVKPDGSASFEHMVESVDMRQRLSDRGEVRYNSRTDEQAPREFGPVAESVGVVLSSVTMDAQGKIVSRKQQRTRAGAKNEGEMTIPLPDEPVAVGHTWSLPHEIEVKLNTGAIKKVRARQTLTLESVKTGVARIRMATQILTPIEDPAMQSQLILGESSGTARFDRGTVRFDIDAGRVLGQEMEVDKHVVGFSGQTSSLHYVTRFTEKLLPAAAKTASRPDGKRR